MTLNCAAYIFHISATGYLNLYPHLLSRKEFSGLTSECRHDRTLVLHRSWRLFFHTFIFRYKDYPDGNKESFIGLSVTINSGYVQNIIELVSFFETFYLNNAYLLAGWLDKRRFLSKEHRRFSVASLSDFLFNLESSFNNKFKNRIYTLHGLGVKSEISYFLTRTSSEGILSYSRKYVNTFLRSKLNSGERIVYGVEDDDSNARFFSFPGTMHEEVEWDMPDNVLRQYYNLGDARAMFIYAKKRLSRPLTRVSKKDRVLVVYILNHSCNLGYYNSHLLLGECYERAVGCTYDLSKAKHHYMKGANHFVKDCCYRSSVCCRNEKGKSFSNIMGNLWLLRGMLQGEKICLQSFFRSFSLKNLREWIRKKYNK